MTDHPITAPTATEIVQQLHDAQTALAEVRSLLEHDAATSAALDRAPVTRSPLLKLVDHTCQATARTVVRLELADQPAETGALTAETLAQLLSAADVKINSGDYPHWEALSEDGRDQYREAAMFLLARCSVTNRAAAPVEGLQA